MPKYAIIPYMCAYMYTCMYAYRCGVVCMCV